MSPQRRFRVNRRLILTVTLVCFVLAAGTLLLHNKQVSASVDRSRATGLSAAAEEDWHQAVSHLRFYLDNRPDDVEALAACARSLADGYGEFEEAFAMYERALKLDHYQHEARRKFIELALKLDRLEQAEDHSKLFLKRFPWDTAGLELAARVAEADNRLSDAYGHYLRITKNEPTHPLANQRLAVLSHVLYRNGRAVTQAIDRLKKSGDESFDTHRTLAEFSLSRGRAAQAADHLLSAIEVMSGQTAEAIAASQIAVRICSYSGDREIAARLESSLREILRSEQEKQPDSIFFEMTLASLQSHAGQFEESLATLKNGITRLPDNCELRFQRAWQLIELHRIADADKEISQILKSKNGVPETTESYVSLLNAVRLLQNDELKSAVSAFRSLATKGIKPPAMAPVAGRLEAFCHQQTGDWESATKVWNRVAKLAPDNRQIQFSLALSQLVSGNHAEGVRILNHIPRLGELIVALDSQRESTPSESTVNRLRPPNALGGLVDQRIPNVPKQATQFVRALLSASRNEFAEAHAAVRDLSIPERLLDIVALTSSSKALEPSAFDEIVRVDPDDARALTAMVLARNDGADVERLSAIVRQRLTDVSPEVWVQRSRVLISGIGGASRSLRNSDPKRSQYLDRFSDSLLSRMVKIDPSTMPQMIKFHLTADRFDEAIRWCRAAWPTMSGEVAPLWLSAARQTSASHSPVDELERHLLTAVNAGANGALKVTLADLYLMTGRPKKAETVYREILETNPDSISALNNVAWLLSTRQEELLMAAELIDHAIELRGQQASLLDTRGCVRLASGETDGAIRDFQEAVKRGGGPDSLFHLAVALHQSGKVDSADQTLNQAFRLGFDFSAVSPLEQHLASELKK